MDKLTISDLCSSTSAESAMLRLYTKTSFYPVTSEQKPPTPLTRVNVCTCGNHVVTLYCRTEDILLCRPCKYPDHMRCQVEKISEIAKGSLSSKELETTMKELTSLKLVFQRMKENKRLKNLQNRQLKQSMLKLSKRWKMLQSTRVAFNRVVGMGIDNYQDITNTVEKVLVRKSRWVVQQISGYLVDINEYMQEENEIAMYIVLYKIRRDLQEYRKILNEIVEDKNQGDVFEGLKTMITGIYHCDNPGNVTLARTLMPKTACVLPDIAAQRGIPTPTERSKSTQTFGTPRRPPRSSVSPGSRRFRPAFRPHAIRMATFMSSLHSGRSSGRRTRTSIVLRKLLSDAPPKRFSINSPFDQSTQHQITALCPLNDGKLLVLDCRNNNIKLFSKDDTFITDLDFECSLWGCTLITRFEALITCPSEGKLQRVQIVMRNGTRAFELVKTGYILTQKECRAICFLRNRIYITYTGPKPCIKILSKEGIMYRSIEFISRTTTLFKNPLYMYVEKLGKIIYVSDFSLQRVTKIDHKGNLLGTVDVSPGWPLGLCMREEGMIVAVSGTKDIRMITRGGSKANVLIGPHVLEGEPCMITLKETAEGKQLYVAYTGKAVIKVFKIF